MRIVEKELRRIARRRIARRRTLPRPFWLRIHASKPAPWLRPPPDGAFASVPAFATCASMFIPLGVDGAAGGRRRLVAQVEGALAERLRG